MIGVTILGSTGSIGGSTLDVLARQRARFRVIALGAQRDVERMVEQCLAFRPQYAALADAAAAERLAQRLRGKTDTQVLAGAEGLEFIARLPQAHYVMAAIVGAAGLPPTLAALRAGKRVLLANKEALVMAGALFMDALRGGGATLLPIDSEHNAVFQCLPHHFNQAARPDCRAAGVRRILLTASGGPFRTLPLAKLEQVTPVEACAHPNWVMGKKISVDSATMMNKGLEVIEATWLFGVPPDKVEVLLHPQSVIHSLVEYQDGSVLAELASPDMRVPIAHALAWPERIESGAARLDLAAVGRLEFSAVEHARYPCLNLAYQAANRGGTAPAILNAANEVAVRAFLDEKIPFTGIAGVVEAALAAQTARPAAALEAVLEDDARARACAAEQIIKLRAPKPRRIKNKARVAAHAGSV
ncbi:MAG: 1-deoxy-D-xylulose-5-phosphate reductoisomerase, partial [Gammaproteobacteria bacterium]|nr:1-deoxy-D-xylulose-5-phosphate reductoisomerase [Gammaproteobacteria bacterium]